MKKIEKTIGFVIVNDKNEIVAYQAGASENGMCFKDENARGDEVAYIPEYADWDDDYCISRSKSIYDNYTYNELVDEIKNYDTDLELTDKQAEWLANNILAELDWKNVSTFLLEMDWDAVICDDEDGIFTEKQKEMCW